MTAPLLANDMGPESDDKVKKHAPVAFTTSAAISDFLVSPTDFLASRPDIHNLIAGAMVFRCASDGSSSMLRREILLLRRAASDSFPLKWEIPAGTADPSADPSIAAVAVRELWEETQLRARRLYRAVGLGLPNGATNLTSAGDVQDARMDSEIPICLLRFVGLTWGVVTFLTDLEDEETEVVLQEDEHVEWAWVAESEVDTGRFQSRESLDFVSEAMKMIILEGFRLMRELA